MILAIDAWCFGSGMLLKLSSVLRVACKKQHLASLCEFAQATPSSNAASRIHVGEWIVEDQEAFHVVEIQFGESQPGSDS
jgi:hypothetical protein